MQVIDAISIAGSLAILGAVVWLTATGRLKPRYSLLWIAAAGLLVAVSVWRDLIDIAGQAFGIAYRPALVFLAADVFLMLILLHMSIVVSRLSDRTRRLSQEIALLRDRLGETAEAGSQAPPRAPGPDRCEVARPPAHQ